MWILKKFFGNKTSQEKNAKIVKHVKVLVTSFADNLKKNSGKQIFEMLQKNDLLDVAYYADGLPASSLTIDSKNLLEMSDFSVHLFRKIPTDVIIFGHQEKDKLCLNFISYGEYDDLSPKVWRVFDCLYLPLELFEQQNNNIEKTVNNLILGAVLLCKKNLSSEAKARQKNMLKNLIKFFETDENIGNLPEYCIPYTLNLLASIYFEYAEDKIDKKSFDSIKFMLENALRKKDLLLKKIHIASIYLHIGMLFNCVAQNMHIDCLSCYNKATRAYKLAQKYFMKQEYPYDYAQICYLCAKTYFAEWNYTENLDSLSAAIASLREVEKIYTEKAFPASWARLQHELGYYLSLLGNYTGSPEVLMMAIQNMQNAQKVFYAQKYPFIWLDVQSDIGRVYYFLGKKYQDVESLRKAEKVFREALLVCEAKNAEDERRKIDTDISKTIELIYKMEKF